MDNPQYYQPLSHALHPPLVSSSHPPQQYSYPSHTQLAAPNGTNTSHREEEEEDDDDEEVVEEELDPESQQANNNSPRATASTHAGCKAASPIVIAQCYQMGPATKIDPLAMIAEAKRLANPSQLVGNPPPAVYSMPTYPTMPAPTATPSTTSSTPGPVINQPQSFVMSLGNASMPPPAHAPPPQPYYPPHMYPATARYPTAPYYSYPTQPTTPYYPPPPQTTPTPTHSTPTPAPAPSTSTSGTISTFNAATGTAAPGGQQGTWSEEETDRLRKLAEQSKEMGGAQNKGEIEWDWVVQQWGNSRTRHQILLKATSMGLKESTTRGTKRRREAEANDSTNEHTATPASQTAQTVQSAQNAQTTQTVTTATTTPTIAPASIQTQPAPTTIPTPASASFVAATNASPTITTQRPPSSTTPTTIAPARTTTQPNTTTPTMPWPMPTVAANTPSPVLASASIDQRNSMYRPTRPTHAQSYGAASTSTTTSYGAAAAANSSASPSDVGRAVGGDTNGTAQFASSSGQGSVNAEIQVRARVGGFATAMDVHLLLQSANNSPYTSPATYSTPHIYPTNVTSYGSSSLSGATTLPSTGVIYPPMQTTPHAHASGQAPAPGQSQAPSSSVSAGKRKQLADGSIVTPSPRKRRANPIVFSGDVDDSDVGPNGGPKHWTDTEKNSLFNWLMVPDKNWEMFKSKMNTVFRDAAAQIFNGRKSFTALKSCYHRNIETFKQIYAFEAYITRTGNDQNAPPPFAQNADPTMSRQAHLEQRLEEARSANAPVGNLNVKVIDHWQQMGWYDLFKSRFREDPRTGVPVPFYANTMTFPDGPAAQPPVYTSSSIDPHLENGRDDDDDDDDRDVEPEIGRMSVPPEQNDAGPANNATPASTQYSVPAPAPLGGDRDYAPQLPRYVPPSRKSVPPTRVTYAPPAAPADSRAEQTVQALDRLTAVTQSLVQECAALTQLLRAEQAERRARSEHAGPREDGMNRKEKAALATEMLGNGDVGDEVRKAAADYLKRLFMSG
ncbi:hypothetical protein WOLCODRAFT_89730 [Wolfiporia cocos MD-104 SS10]|uniref:Myb-like domain-containing protein n=1 Tax=Wolfiporia cocos (strain MD-104) TaxID=742152 RepID=A0A2H3JZU6_WOLCO|nr:hypothetical protein WOLCODRAFT_89730 [Wolfiporia cocos MD-104 SS10]